MHTVGDVFGIIGKREAHTCPLIPNLSELEVSYIAKIWEGVVTTPTFCRRVTKIPLVDKV